MFCTKCGKQIPDSTKFCPYCGANCSPEQDIASQASQVFNKAEQELGSAFNEVKQSFTGSNNQIIIRVTMLIRITAMVIIMAQSHHTQVQD